MSETTFQKLVPEAMEAASPDEAGSLMRELTKRGVDGPVRQGMRELAGFQQRPRGRRSRYVRGWRPGAEEAG